MRVEGLNGMVQTLEPSSSFLQLNGIRTCYINIQEYRITRGLDDV